MKQKERKKRKQDKKKTNHLDTKDNQKITNEAEAVKIREKSNLILGEKDKIVGDNGETLSPDQIPEGVEFEIEYVAASPFDSIDPDDEETFDSLRRVLDFFTAKQNKANQVLPANEAKEAEKPVVEKKSKKRRKLERRLPIAVLKQLVARPDLVEIHDTCAADPFLLMHLKAYHNSVPVPRHWSQKRKYLQGKRGIEKPPFDLPFFIKKTGIMEVRNAGIEKDSHKTLKQDQREKLNPSMGRMDIDYQVLHDAFFKYQTKPKMTYFGDLYYEGKEYEVEMKEKRPGILSKELKEALGMPEGAPPPWLINMQRVGPPPSYPHLKIPGLNAPIPPGADYGYHPGGWGRPPVDEHNRPLYSDAYAEEEIIKPTPYNEIIKFLPSLNLQPLG
uniref:PSP proline-rich domain-containing protein n=1 Tax=Arcella intermedia TaxID=1963864 RepID=A0A6B2L6I0_9EUKA